MGRPDEAETGARPSSPRTLGRVHLETDASVNHARSRGGVQTRRTFLAGAGVILRTESMLPLVVESVPLGFVESAVHAEGLALRYGVRRALDLGATHVRARSDCAALISVLEGRGSFQDDGLCGLVDEIRGVVAELESFEILWTSSFHSRTRGDGVPAADHLAREAAGLGTRSPTRGRRR